MIRINSCGKIEEIYASKCFVLAHPISYIFLEKLMSTIKPNTTTEQTTNFPTTEEVKDNNAKYSLSKFEYDLYHEEDDISERVIRVKRVSMPNKGEKWKIMNDNKVVFTIESGKISKKEREYLQTVEGFNFVLAQAKTGIKSLNSFRNELKKIIDKKPVSNDVVQKQMKLAKKSK